MDSARALECLADSPPDLFVYSPLNVQDMDILDVSDEELAPLQAFVDEIKGDSSDDGSPARRSASKSASSRNTLNVL